MNAHQTIASELTVALQYNLSLQRLIFPIACLLEAHIYLICFWPILLKSFINEETILAYVYTE